MSNYRVVLRGVLPGKSVEEVAKALTSYSSKSPDVLGKLLSSGKSVLAKRTPDVQKAVKYKQALEAIGCRCLIEAEITEEEPVAASSPGTSVTVNLTTNVDSASVAPREVSYARTPFATHLREFMKFLRVKEWMTLALLLAVLYYGWDRIASAAGF